MVILQNRLDEELVSMKDWGDNVDASHHAESGVFAEIGTAKSAGVLKEGTSLLAKRWPQSKSITVDPFPKAITAYVQGTGKMPSGLNPEARTALQKLGADYLRYVQQDIDAFPQRQAEDLTALEQNARLAESKLREIETRSAKSVLSDIAHRQRLLKWWFLLEVETVLFCGFLSGLFGGLTGRAKSIEDLAPHGIRSFCRNTFIGGAVFGVLGSLLCGIFHFLRTADPLLSTGGALIGGLSTMAIACCCYNGIDVISHLLLRFMLRRAGRIPGNYENFLNICTELIFGQRVGGGFIFVYRLLLEHFASLDVAEETSRPRNSR